MSGKEEDDNVGRGSQPLSATSNHGTRLADLDREEAAAEGGVGGVQMNAITEKKSKGNDEVTWRSLPHRRQLVILTLARLSEPLVQTSLQTYMFYQLKSFDETLPDSAIAMQAGLMASSFTGAQFFTAMLWGRVSDSPRGGRKLVLLIGLFGTMLSCLGFGFAKTFWQAFLCRSLAGALNGNIGVMRTMVSEIVQEKKYQSRAFLLFPMCFNIGTIIGPVLGGLLADPAGSYPSVFGHVTFLKKFPYAPPNLLSAFFLGSAGLAVFFGLSETLESLRHKEDLGIKLGRIVWQCMTSRSNPNSHHAYAPLSGDERVQSSLEEDVEMSPATSTTPGSPARKRKSTSRWKQKLPFRRIFTYNVTCTLIAHTLLATHLGTFNNLWYVFLSTPVYDPAHPAKTSLPRKLPFIFTGGLGMQPNVIGLAMAILGLIGISMQLFIYPIINAKIGTVRSWRIFLYCFPVAYLLIPFLSIVPSKSLPPAAKDGILFWMSLCVVIFIQVTGRTFALPATTILVNNACPHPSALGTMHGIGQSLSSAGRTIGPSLAGVFYGLGLRKGIVGAVFWGLSALAMVNIVASLWVKEGNGHEIILEGDEEAEAEWQAGEEERMRSSGRQRLKD